jgi:protein SCO1/2
MDHTAGSYAFDPAGRLRLYIKHAQGPETLAHDLKELLK